MAVVDSVMALPMCSSAPTCVHTYNTPTSTTTRTPDTTCTCTPTADNIGTMFSKLSPYSPLHTENSTTPTPTYAPTAEAIDAAITAQTNLAADYRHMCDFEGDFSLFATTCLVKEMWWWWCRPAKYSFSLSKINSAALALVERISINNIDHLFHQ